MKKIFIMMFVAAAATNINAQLEVDSIGKVRVGTLSVGGNENGDKVISGSTNSKKYIAYFTNQTDDIDPTFGHFSYVSNSMGNCIGGKSIVRGSDDTSLSQTVIGFAGYASRARTGVGLWGGPDVGSSLHVNFAGVYGSQSPSLPSFTNYPGKYAGYFNGKVRVTNGIYATVISPSASPSPSGQSGTTILSDRGESVTDKLSQVQAVQFLRYEPDRKEAVSEDEEAEPEPYLSPIQYGLDANQLKTVYPELVYEDANGNVSINYVEMVPLLVQSIKELKDELAELKGTPSKKTKVETTAIDDNVSDVDMVRMDQNKPNPFSESTVIALSIPEKSQKASIFIYDMSGKQVQSIAVSERGETNITVYASDLTAGMYIYTLVVDGKVAVTRRMIVTI